IADSERAEWTHFLHCQKKLAQIYSETAKPKTRNSASTQSCARPSTDRDSDLFAPPANLSFAPPAFNDTPHASADPMDIDDDDEYYPPPAVVAPPTYNNTATLPSLVPSDILQGSTGDDAYMRRLQLTGMSQQPDAQAHTEFTQQPQQPIPPVSSAAPPNSAPPTTAAIPSIDMAAKVAEAQARLAAVKAKINAQHAQTEIGKSAEPSSTPPQHATS
ncbi:5296_t:CDS:1, partial [Scutellospora calospora]